MLKIIMCILLMWLAYVKLVLLALEDHVEKGAYFFILMFSKNFKLSNITNHDLVPFQTFFPPFLWYFRWETPPPPQNKKYICFQILYFLIVLYLKLGIFQAIPTTCSDHMYPF